MKRWGNIGPHSNTPPTGTFLLISHLLLLPLSAYDSVHLRPSLPSSLSLLETNPLRVPLVSEIKCLVLMWILSFNFAIFLGSLFPLFSSCTPQRQRLSRRPLDDCSLALVGNTQVNQFKWSDVPPQLYEKLVVPHVIVMRFTWKHHDVHLQVVTLDNNRSLSKITTWAFLKECNMYRISSEVAVWYLENGPRRSRGPYSRYQTSHRWRYPT